MGWIFVLIAGFFGSGVWVALPEEQEEKYEGQILTITSEGTLTAVSAAESFAERRAIASDGGSSTYYDIGLPQWLLIESLNAKRLAALTLRRKS